MKYANYIESQYRDLLVKQLINPEFDELYESIEHKKLREILSSLHKQLVDLFKLMNDRLPTKDHSAHFWADPSRDLIFAIDMALGLYRSLKNSSFAIEIDSYYLDLLRKCQGFLSSSGGSPIPENMDKIDLYYTLPIFLSSETQIISRSGLESFQNLKLIGQGSYAKVFKFKDDFYKKYFVLKRAKSDLNEKEIERFKLEFEEMNKLKSPYIVEVYSFYDSKKEYLMEYMDTSLDKYISKNNGTLTISERRSISLQILKAFSYLRDKNLLHRDISPNNILIKEYEDTIVVKISDFGLVKLPNSELTSMNTELKGYFNDPELATEGFSNYRFVHEVYALTKLLFFVLTGKTNVSKIKDDNIKKYVEKGLNPDKSKRYKSIDEIRDAVLKCYE